MSLDQNCLLTRRMVLGRAHKVQSKIDGIVHVHRFAYTSPYTFLCVGDLLSISLDRYAHSEESFRKDVVDA